MRPLEPRERRLVAIGLLVASVALVWLAGVAPLLAGFQARAERRAELLARYQADVHLTDALPALRAAVLSARRDAALYQVSAPSQTVAADALRQRVQAALADAGGVVSAVQPVSIDVAPGAVSVRADGEINLTQLTAALRRLENQTPYVVVDYISIGADRAAASGHAAPLQVRLQLSALYHPAQAR